MSAPFLLITPAQRLAVNALMGRAAETTRSLAVVKRLAAGDAPDDLNRDLTIWIGGYVVAYTHEEQREDLVCRHLSVSKTGAALPSSIAVAAIMREFGFVNALGVVPMWFEKLGDGSSAVNVIEPLDGDLSHLEVQVEGAMLV